MGRTRLMKRCHKRPRLLLQLPFHPSKLCHSWIQCNPFQKINWFFVSQSHFHFFYPPFFVDNDDDALTPWPPIDDKDGSSASIDTFCSMYTSFPSTLTCFHRLECLAVAISRPTGELCFLGLRWHFLTILLAIWAFFVFVFALLCASVHRVDASAWFPQPSAPPLCHIFAVVFASIRAFCTCVRVPDASEMMLSLCGSFVRDLLGFPDVLRLSDGFFRYSRVNSNTAHRYTCPTHLNGFISPPSCLCAVLRLWQVSLAFLGAPARVTFLPFASSATHLISRYLPTSANQKSQSVGLCLAAARPVLWSWADLTPLHHMVTHSPPALSYLRHHPALTPPTSVRIPPTTMTTAVATTKRQRRWTLWTSSGILFANIGELIFRSPDVSVHLRWWSLSVIFLYRKSIKKFASSLKLDALTCFLLGRGTRLTEFFKRGQ